MLVLTRKRGESLVFVLPDGREIRVVQYGVRSHGGFGPGRVKLGVEAPADVKVYRDELLTEPRGEES